MLCLTNRLMKFLTNSLMKFLTNLLMLCLTNSLVKFLFSAYCKDAHLAIYDGFENLEFEPKKPKQYCGDLSYYKNAEDKYAISNRNRLLIR